MEGETETEMERETGKAKGKGKAKLTAKEKQKEKETEHEEKQKRAIPGAEAPLTLQPLGERLADYCSLRRRARSSWQAVARRRRP